MNGTGSMRYMSEAHILDQVIRPAFEIPCGDVVERGRFGVGAEGRLQVGVVGEVLRGVEEIRAVLRIPRCNVMTSPDVGFRIALPPGCGTR